VSEDFSMPGGLGAGSLVAGYRIESRIGAGGMAVVYRARDERLGRSIALKVMAPQWAEDEEFRHRFVAESRAAASVDDPHVIPVYQAGAAGGVLFIAMRLVAGTDLRGVLRREGVLPPGRALELLSPVASALDAAHAAGLVHRDVKPGNILVDELPGRPDHVYLSDFGLSKGVAAGMSLTGPGTYLGTPRYSAPEQVQGNRVDGRADQYALACVAFELLAGRAPFERDHPMAVMLAHLSEPPPSLAGRRPALPVAVDRVMTRALAKIPEQRYASCRDFADALREALGLTPYGAGSTAMSGRLHADTFAPPVPGGPTEAGALRQPGAAARESGSLAPGPGTTVGLERPTRHPRRGLLVVALTGAVLAAAVVIPWALARPGPPGASSPGTTATKTAARTQGATAPSGPPTDLPPDPGRADQDVTSVAFKPGTTTLAVAKFSGSVYLWDTKYQSLTAVLDDPRSYDGVTSLAFEPVTGALADGDGNGSVYLWDDPTAQTTPTATLTAPVGKTAGPSDPFAQSVSSMAFEPGTTTLAVGYSGGNVYLWDTTAQTIAATLTAPAGSQDVTSVAFEPGTTTLAVGYRNGSVYLWDDPTARTTPTATLAATLAAPAGRDGVTSLAWEPGTTTLAVGYGNGSVSLWSTTTKTKAATLTAPAGSQNVDSDPVGRSVNSMAFEPGTATLALGYIGGNVYLWDTTTKRITATLIAPVKLPSADVGPFRHTVASVAFGPGTATLAAGYENGNTYLWRIKSDSP
jgi:WD40 repeat protein